VRVLAWLSACPENSERTRFEMLKNPDKSGLPEVDSGRHLISFLSELGYAEPGPETLSYKEIKAWSELTKTELTASEVLAIRNLSSAFCIEYQKSNKKNVEKPDKQGLRLKNSEEVAKDLKALIARYKG
jgi:hypothetical protein